MIKWNRTDKISLANLILFVALTTVGIYVTIMIQNRIEDVEIKNRVQTFRPKLELKDTLIVSNVVIDRDTSWLNSEYDYYKNDSTNEDVKTVGYYLYSDFTFNLINTSEHIADIICMVFFDTTSTIPKNIEELFIGDIGSGSKLNEIIQLDYQDSFTVNMNDHKIHYIDDNKFYLHLSIFYENQFGDMYITYLIITGEVGDLPLILISSTSDRYITLGTFYMKNSFLNFSKPKRYTYYVNDENKIYI